MVNSEPRSLYNEVFISYSRENRDFAKRLVNAIYEKGYKNVWVDWEDIEYAEDWWQKIESGIESANNFIFLLSPDSAKSQICFKEVHHAVKSGKRIIPVLYRELSQDEKEAIHPAISQHNWLPLGGGDDFNAGVDMLIKTISTDLDHVRFHTRLLTRARDWEDANQSQLKILNQGELKEAQEWLSQSDQHLKEPRPIKIQRDYLDSSQRFYRRRLRNMLIGGFAILAFVLTYWNIQNLRTQTLAAENRALSRVISVNDFGPGFGWEEFTLWSDIEPDQRLITFGEDEDGTGYLELYLPDGNRDDSTEGYGNRTQFPANLDIEARFRIVSSRSDLPHDFEIWLIPRDGNFVAIRYHDEHGPDIMERADDSFYTGYEDDVEGLEIGQWYTTNIKLRDNIVTVYIDGERVLQHDVAPVNANGGSIALVGGGDAIVHVDYLNILHLD